ncbi:MAG: sulfatase-like hydrolase/transferase, partial [Elusimicrobia bacterium]|nr:sulfatase-like hydrolase/transferase [Elusimicrobiota bacterium]
DRRGGIDARWYPAFARLSREAAWYRDARTAADDTMRAVPALLSGTLPRPPKEPWARDYPRNLFTLLAGAYRLDVTEAGTALCPPSLCRPARAPPAALALTTLGDLAVVYAHLAAPRAWEGRLPPLSGTWSGYLDAHLDWKAFNAANASDARDRAGQVHRFIAGIRGGVPPTLHYLHVELPHAPWVYFPSGARAYAPNEPIVVGDGGQADRWRREALAERARQRHILQARFTDRLVGELVSRLRAEGLWDRCLLVVTADHGSAFRGGERRRLLTPGDAGAILPVPLFIKYPAGGPSGPQDGPVSLLDVLPTVLEAAGLKTPPALDGVSLLSPTRRKGPPPFVSRAGTISAADAGFDAARRDAARRIALLGDGEGARLYALGPAAGLV